MKQPTAPPIYPELPIEDGQNYRLQKISEIERKLIIERDARRLFCFGSLVILDVARCYLWLFTLYINIKISKNSC